MFNSYTKHLSKKTVALAVLALASPFVTTPALASGDWPMWGGDPARNMVVEEANITTTFFPGDFKGDTDEIDMATTENVKWVAKLGSQAYGNPNISDGVIVLGTNNESPRDPDITDDRGIVLALDEATGGYLWQLAIPKLGAGKVSDWEYLGICSSPAIDEDRVYVVTNRCEIICLDLKGMADGENDGDFQWEAGYIDGSYFAKAEAGNLTDADKTAPTDAPGGADIVWVYDMRAELGVFPHNIASNSALVIGDIVYVATSNGVDWSHINIPNPNAPALIALDKNTGELIGEEASGISSRTFHCNWSSPTYAEIDGVPQLVFGAGDGFTYGFDPEPVEDEDGFLVFKELWRYDCNPPHYRKNDDGKKIKYATYKGPSEIISTPVVVGNRVYVAIGQDPEHGEGLGNLVCIDATKRGDITETGRIWEYDKIDRSISTAAVDNGLVFMSDYEGVMHCLNADTGELYWTFNTESHIWGSPFLVGGKVLLGNEDGVLFVFENSKELSLIETAAFLTPIYSSPIVANDVLYVPTQTHLYAIAAE